MPVKFSVNPKSDTEVDLLIYGRIGANDESWGDGTNNYAVQILRELNGLSSSVKRLNVHILSPGGYVDEGLAIYNALKSSKLDVHTYNDGFVGSMASIIILAGTTHFPKTSVYHLHRASSSASGTITDFEQSIEQLKKFETALKTAISEKTKLSIETIEQNWFDGGEHFLSAEEAKSFGFVDFIEDYETKNPINFDQMKSMNYSKVAAYFNAPENEKEEGILQAFISKLQNLFSTNNLQSANLNNNQMTSIKSPVRLLALMSVAEFVLNSSGNAELTVDQIMALEKKISDDQATIDSLNAQINAKEDEKTQMSSNIDTLSAKIAELENQIKDFADKTPAGTASNPRSSDHSNQNGEIETSAETLAALREYNKKNLYR